MPDWPATRGAQLLATEVEARALYGNLRAHAPARPDLVPHEAQVYTASYIVNVAGNTYAGTYTTTLTYICTPTF